MVVVEIKDPIDEIISFSAEVAVNKPFDFVNWKTTIEGMADELGSDQIETLW